MQSLRKEQDKLQQRIGKMYDDKLDGLIEEKLYLEKVKAYKSRQLEILEEMKRHEVADENYYITVNTVLNLASRAREIFESSEVREKRQLLNLMFQNLQLRGVSLSVQVTEPFKTMVDFKECPINWRWRESNTVEWIIFLRLKKSFILREKAHQKTESKKSVRNRKLRKFYALDETKLA
jgi:hypothetical protein